MKLLHDFSPEWNAVGMELGFTQPELTLIQNTPSLFMTAPVSYMQKLLNQWVQWPKDNHPTKPTLKILCEAVGSSSVGLGRLAEKIKIELTANRAGDEMIIKISSV